MVVVFFFMIGENILGCGPGRDRLVARAWAYGPLSAGCRVEPALAWLKLSVGVSIWATFITAFLPAITAGLGMGRL